MCIFERPPKAAGVDYSLKHVVKEELGGVQLRRGGGDGGGGGCQVRIHAGTRHLLRARCQGLPFHTSAATAGGSQRTKTERRCGI